MNLLSISTISDFGLLAQLFSAERVKAVQSNGKTDRTVGYSVNSNEIIEGSNIVQLVILNLDQDLVK